MLAVSMYPGLHSLTEWSLQQSRCGSNRHCQQIAVKVPTRVAGTSLCSGSVESRACYAIRFSTRGRLLLRQRSVA